MYSQRSNSLEITSSPQGPTTTITDHGISRKDQNPSADEKIGKNSALGNHKPFLGLFYITSSVICFQLLSVIVKKTEYMNPSQLSLIRNAGVIAGCLPITIYYTKRIFGEKHDLLPLIIRSLLSSTGLYLALVAYRFLPLAEAAIVLSTLPIVTAVVARFLIREACGLIQTICLILTVIGVLSAVRLPELLRNRTNTRFDYLYFWGLAAAVSGVLSLAVGITLLCKLRKTHYSIHMLYMGISGIIESAIANVSGIPFVSAFCGWDQFLCFMIGVFGFLGSMCFVLATQVEFAGIIAAEKSSVEIIISIVFQILFFYEYPDLYNIIGACLMLASLSILGFKNWLSMLPEDSKMKTKLKIFML